MPTGPNSKCVTSVLTLEEAQRLENEALATERSQSYLIRKAIKQFLEQHHEAP
ncbi:MAG TPA: ribbon-helix-helix protein, CopG family [Candidatus Nanoarchaeia archaeon]|nr:ribbon-helix-helix protein, CopG family [Candidatus Nanoarchaeia archaeon]